MTIRRRPVVSEDDMRYYFCVDYGGSLFAFENEEDAFKAYKALNNSLGVSSYFEYSDESDNVSGMLHNVIKECSSSLQRRKLIHKKHIAGLYSVELQVKCDEPGCWKTEDLNEDGSIPDGWQEIDDKHYCHAHSK